MTKKDSSAQTSNNIDILSIITKDMLTNSGYVTDDNYSSSDDECNDESNYAYKVIDKKINSIDDLIELGKTYDPSLKVKYNIDLCKISKLVEPLTELKNMIGLDNIKEKIIDQIIYFLADLEDKSNDMMHTVITGPPGVGKTKLGQIIGKIYNNLGILTPVKKKRKRGATSNYTFRIIKRSDLIGKYLGHTASKTQDVINSCDGGVMFIDEAYSLGNPNVSDSFSKECIDTINQNLTEKKSNFLCIIAGYEDALESSFFSYNEGLRRRFTFRYNIEEYTYLELKQIFYKMIEELNWTVNNDDDDKITKLFLDNKDELKNMAGDVESLLFHTKIIHGKRVFYDNEQKKKVNYDDVKNGLNMFKQNKKIKNKNTTWQNLYL